MHREVKRRSLIFTLGNLYYPSSYSRVLDFRLLEIPPDMPAWDFKKIPQSVLTFYNFARSDNEKTFFGSLACASKGE